jgi:hypothetical protein
MMSGDLESDVLTMPFFPGKEKHFLRAQIARISSSSCLALTGFLSVNDDETSVSQTPDFEFPAHEELKAQEAWVHSHAFIHKNGCTTWPDPDLIEDQELKMKIEREREDEPKRGPLAPIAEDKPAMEEGGSKDWRIKQAGDKGAYNFDGNTKSYICTVVKSTRWPGAVTVAQGTKFANLYVGYGFKQCVHETEKLKEEKMTSKALPFTSGNEDNPCAPADIMDEPKDHEEQPEPNPQDDDEQSDHAEEDDPQPGEE